MKTKTRKQTREVKVQRSEGTAAYFSGTESKIKSKDFRIEGVIDPKQFSNFYKLFRIAAYVLRFIENSRNKLRQKSPALQQKKLIKHDYFG